MTQIDGVNWCEKYHHEIDYDLVHSIAADCEEKKKYHGCARCPHSTYRIFRDKMQIDPQTNKEEDVLAMALIMFKSAGGTAMKCVICGEICPPGSVTCCEDHHEEFVMKVEAKVGTHKRILSMVTGKTHWVPVRDIIEKGIRHDDLASYPVVK